MTRQMALRVIPPALLAALAFLVYASSPMLLPRLGVDNLAAAVLIHNISGTIGWFSLAWAGSRLVDLFIKRAAYRSTPPTPVPRLLNDVIRGFLFVVAGVAILSTVFNRPVSGLLATSGLVVAVLGFALRNIIADVFSGIAINVEEPYQIGDWLELESGVTGQVREITWRSTRIVTNNETIIIVPNGMIASSRFTNYSTPLHRYRSTVRVTLDFRVPIERAKRVLMTGVLGVPGVLGDPMPDVVVEGADERGITYAVRYWVTDYAREIPMRDAVNSGLFATMQNAGLRIGYPKRIVSMDRRALPERQDRPRFMNLVRQLSALKTLSEAELRQFQDKVIERIFMRGEIILREGEMGNSIFMLAEGVLDVMTSVEQGPPLLVERLRPGAIFGESSLLVDTPRMTSIVAATDAIVYELAREELEEFLEQHPDIAAKLQALMTRRRETREARRAQHGKTAPTAPTRPHQSGLFRWRRLFGNSQ